MQQDTRFSTMTWLWRCLTQLEEGNIPGNQLSALSALLLNGFRFFFRQCILDGGENVPLESFEGLHHLDRLPEPRKTVGDVVLTTENRASHDRISDNELLALSPLLLNGFWIFFHQCILGGGENVPSESFEGSHHPYRSPELRKTVGDLVLATETSESHHRTSGNELLAFSPLLLNGFWVFFYQRTLGGEENGGENVPAHDSSECSKKRKHADPRMYLLCMIACCDNPYSWFVILISPCCNRFSYPVSLVSPDSSS